MRAVIPSLNGLRAISIALVVVLHLMYTGDLHSKYDDWLYIFVKGHFGVNIFFVISGFLITNLMLKEENENQSVSLKNFYLRRVIRIFPAYYFFYLFISFFK